MTTRGAEAAGRPARRRRARGGGRPRHGRARARASRDSRGTELELAYRLAPVPAARAREPPRPSASASRGATRDVVVDEDTIRVVEATRRARGRSRGAPPCAPHAARERGARDRPGPARRRRRREAEAAAARIERLLDGPAARPVPRSASRPSAPVACARWSAPSARTGRSASPSTRRASTHRFVRGSACSRSPPRDATFWVGAKRAHVVPSRPGKTLDLERISRSLVVEPRLDDASRAVHAHRAGVHDGGGRGARHPRARSRSSRPTTSAAQPRVTNIQRAAELLDGTILLPGKAFSLNQALGKRTVEKGFVSAPQIFNARLEEAVGGGISQVATTLYNAAFFAGIKLVAHQAHQFYISRYPMGREATVSWGGPELDLPQRLAGGDPRQGQGVELVDHGALLLAQARPPRRDDDGRAVRVRRAAVDPDAEQIVAARDDQHDPVGRRVGVQRRSTRARSSRARARARTSATPCDTCRRTRSSRSARRRGRRRRRSPRPRTRSRRRTTSKRPPADGSLAAKRPGGAARSARRPRRGRPGASCA